MNAGGTLMGNCGGAAQITTKSCLGCGLSLLDKSCTQALGGNWHSSCFTCHDCGSSLSSWYIYKDGNLYCREHYWKLVGESCNQCGLYISGPIMFAGQHRYHPECFKCISCRCIIGFGEAYCFVERSKLYCDSCYRQSTSCFNRDGNNDVSNQVKHSIQMIEVPPAHVGNLLCTRLSNGRRLSIDVPFHRANNVPCINVDSVEDAFIELQAGDKILEVNGCPVKELQDSLNELKLMLEECKPVSLTIERDHKQHSNNDERNFSTSYVPDAMSTTPPMSPTSTTASENDGVGSLRRHAGQRTKNYVKRRSTLPTGYNQTDPHHSGRSETSTHEKHSDINRSSSLKPLPNGQRVFRPSDLEYGATLGSGFFGVAKKVTDKKTGEVMVIKELLKYDKEAQESFLKEVWVLRSLNHPNVLRFIGVLYKGQTLNIVTEFAPGGTLQTRILNSELTWSQRIKFAEDIACGMAYLHSKDIVHRDLNSCNCFLQEDDSVVVADFGLSRSVASREAASPPPSVDLVDRDRGSLPHRRLMFRRLRCKTIVGNPFFMAPEMMHGHSYDEKVDVFSFGIIICEIVARVEADPEFIPRSNDFGLDVEAFSKKYCQGCPEEFFKLVVACCNMDAIQRPSFEDLHRSLTRLLDEKFMSR